MIVPARFGPHGWMFVLVCLLASTSCSFGASRQPTTTTGPPPPPAIPAVALDAYARAGRPCPGVDWATLAGIGKVETDHGRIFGGSLDTDGNVTPQILGPPLDGTGVRGNTTPLPAGDWTGQYGIEGQWLQAVGPMQFLPDSFEIHGADGNDDDVADPHNIYDAVASAVALLCDRPVEEGQPLEDVLLRYNNSTEYQRQVVGWANRYRNATLSLSS